MRDKIAVPMIATSLLSAPVSAQATEDEVAAALHRQVLQCWVGVDDLSKPWELSVSVEATIMASGDLSGDPVITKPAREIEEPGALKTATDRAQRAVVKCAPYDLPENTIDWPQVVTFSFFSQLAPPGV